MKKMINPSKIQFEFKNQISKKKKKKTDIIYQFHTTNIQTHINTYTVKLS